MYFLLYEVTESLLQNPIMVSDISENNFYAAGEHLEDPDDQSSDF